MSGRRIYALDLPGHAGSTGEGIASVAGYLEAILDWRKQVQEPNLVWVGHSMGGAIALQAALDAPRTVAGLVLVGTGAHLPVNPRILEMAAEPKSFRPLVEMIVSWSASPASPERLLELARRRMEETRPQVLQRDFLASDRFDVRARLSEIRVPTLVVCGLDDRMAPEAMSRELAHRIQGASLEFILEAGHMLPLEQPEQVARAIERFLDSADL